MSRSLERLKNHEPEPAVAAEDDQLEAEHDPAVSRRSSLADLRRLDPVQRKAAGNEVSNEAVHDAAARGVASPATALPHADRIQAAFGPGHDVSQIRAHVGGGTANAMGAKAYASGNDVVFDKEPDLHTAAHEAAHVVQQARGVNLYGGVGDAGDRYEKNADAVADRVVAGQSAADLLGPATKGAAPAATGAVQQKKKDNVEDATKEQRDKQHDTAELGTFWSIQAQLTLVASRLIEAGERVREIVMGMDFGDRGPVPYADIIEETYADALAMVQGLFARASTMAKDLGGLKSQIGPELGQVRRAWSRLGIYSQKATGFVKDALGSSTVQTKHNHIAENLKAMYAAFDRTEDEVNTDAAAPKGGSSAAESEAIHKTLDAAFQHLRAARMDSNSDLDAGSQQVMLAGHRTKEAHSLLRTSSDPKKAKKYKADLKKVSAEADKLADTSPNLYMDMKKVGILEEIAAMKKGH